MEQHTIAAKINKLEEEVLNLSNTLYQLKLTDRINHAKRYETYGLKAVSSAEKIACSLRYFLYASNNSEKGKDILMKQVTASQGITIQHTPKLIEITVPCLLPKKTKHAVDFLVDPLYYTLKKYQEEQNIPRQKECVICFSHLFKEQGALKKIRDYDNLEAKAILDMVASFFLIDDGGQYCDVYHTTQQGEKDSTILTIMKKSDFPNWIMGRNMVSDS